MHEDALEVAAADPVWIGDLVDAVAKIRLAMRLTNEQLDLPTGSTEGAGDGGFIQVWLDTLTRYVEAGGGTLSAVVELPGLPPVQLNRPAPRQSPS